MEIPKEEKGKVRKLGIPTVVDRVIQQAIAQTLPPIFEKQFSDNSFGFRPGRKQHDALRKCKKYADEGYVYVVDMDLEKFFDTVCQSKMIEILSRTIKDGKVISLVHKYLNSGVLENGVKVNTPEGLMQGGLCEALHKPPYAKEEIMQSKFMKPHKTVNFKVFTLHNILLVLQIRKPVHKIGVFVPVW